MPFTIKRLKHGHCHETNARLIEDTNLDQVTLVMKMEKESAEKSADLKNREGMALSERHQQILVFMEAGIEYSTEQVAEKIGLTIVYNGNHSTLSDILKGEGTI